MSKTRSISDLVSDLQKENESLQRLAKIANTFCQKEFGYDMKELHEIVRLYEKNERKRNTNEPSQQGQLSEVSVSEI